MTPNFFDKSNSLIVVHGVDSCQNLHFKSILPASLNQSANIFWKAPPAVTDTRKQEGSSTPRIGRKSFTHKIDISSNLLAKIRNLIHERYARGQERIGSIFQEFGCADIDN